MYSVRWGIVIFLVMAGVMLSDAIVCTPDYCSMVRCMQVTKEDCKPNQRYAPRDTSTCNCCGLCITQLGEGELCKCKTVGGFPPTSECGAGLKCDPRSGTCVPGCRSDSFSDSSE